MPRTALLLVAITLAVVAPAAAVAAAAPKPDAHDRALVSRLAAKVTTFQTLASKTTDDTSLQKTLDNCPAIKKDPSLAFAAIFALLPVMLIDVVNQAKPQLVDVRNTLAGMNAHAPLFRQWLAAEQQTFSLILRFDNHGKKIDYCKAATVMLDKHATTQQVRDVLGVDPAVMAGLFDTSPTAPGTKLKSLNPRMRAFFVAGGLAPKMAKTLTS